MSGRALVVRYLFSAAGRRACGTTASRVRSQWGGAGLRTLTSALFTIPPIFDPRRVDAAVALHAKQSMRRVCASNGSRERCRRSSARWPQRSRSFRVREQRAFAVRLIRKCVSNSVRASHDEPTIVVHKRACRRYLGRWGSASSRTSAQRKAEGVMPLRHDGSGGTRSARPPASTPAERTIHPTTLAAHGSRVRRDFGGSTPFVALTRA
jgi:hypothetical protein